jgi:hypothetical protein
VGSCGIVRVRSVRRREDGVEVVVHTWRWREVERRRDLIGRDREAVCVVCSEPPGRAARYSGVSSRLVAWCDVERRRMEWDV